jgi:hypothetical protein
MTLQSADLAHVNDPTVSTAAAASLDPTATENVMHAIVTLIDEYGPLAPWELEQRYHAQRARRDWPLVAVYSVHRRASQVKKQVQVLAGNGDRVRPPGGKAAERLALTVEATAAHAAIRRYMRGEQ